MNYLPGLPVLVVNYSEVPYSPDDEIRLSLQAIHMWSVWFPDHFIVLNGVDDND